MMGLSGSAGRKSSSPAGVAYGVQKTGVRPHPNPRAPEPPNAPHPDRRGRTDHVLGPRRGPLRRWLHDRHVPHRGRSAGVAACASQRPGDHRLPPPGALGPRARAEALARTERAAGDRGHRLRLARDRARAGARWRARGVPEAVPRRRAAPRRAPRADRAPRAPQRPLERVARPGRALDHAEGRMSRRLPTAVRRLPLRVRLAAAIERLPESQRLVLALRLLDGLSTIETAGALKLTA